MRHQPAGRTADVLRFRHGSPAIAVLLGVIALLWTVAACGSGAVDGPDDEASSESSGGARGGDNNGGGGGGDNNGGGGGGDNNGGGGGGDNNGGGGGGDNNGGGGRGDKYSWGLPGGDVSIDSVLEMFNELRRSECDEAQATFDRVNWGGQWKGRKELYQAAIAACKGNLDEARTYFASATINAKGDCRLDEAIRSVLEQRPNQPEARCPESDFEPNLGQRPPSTESSTTTIAESNGSTTSTSVPASTDAPDTGSTVEGGTDTTG
jgi:hypothetical protein